MFKKVALYITIAVVMLVVIYVLIYVGSIVKELIRMEERGIGKELTIVVEGNETIDYKAVLGNRIGGNGREGPFDLCFYEEDVKKLSEFMRQNNYIIAPGEYSINQTFSFCEMKRALKFRKAE